MDAATYNYRRFDDYVAAGDEEREFGAFANELHAGQAAPDFAVTRLDDGRDFPISELWRQRDVVMEFGSFT